ncbi:MAG TPA: hypothetical protein DIT99_19230, partial [Candidatus Latescibacteria bacterium]|nr:hypothetical protein [Candidatus Latescibacterota bacterium]
MRRDLLPSVIITGGATGIGAATVRKFASEGYSVAVLDINSESGAALAAESHRGAVQFFLTDVRDRSSIETSRLCNSSAPHLPCSKT